MIRRKIFFTAFMIWTIFLIFLSLWPSFNKILQQDLKGFRWDYLEHFFCYFIMGFLYVFWRFNQNNYIPAFELIIAISAGLIFSWITEYSQIFVQGRSFNKNDMWANMIGITCGILASYFVLVRILIKNYTDKKKSDC